MATVHDEDKTVELQVAVIGGACGALLSAVAAKAQSGETFADPLAAHVSCVLPLGEVKGWKTSFRFHGFGSDPWQGANDTVGRALDGMARGIDVFVVTGGEPAPTSFAVERFASHWREHGDPKPPVVVLGADAIAASWGALTGTAPEHVGPLDGELLKAVQPAMKAALLSRKG